MAVGHLWAAFFICKYSGTIMKNADQKLRPARMEQDSLTGRKTGHLDALQQQVDVDIDMQHSMMLQRAADFLLEFRTFALKNKYDYLSNIIEPVVIEALGKLHEAEQQHRVSSMTRVEGDDRPVLSSSELECLQWCSLGKTHLETATILGISERLVDFHLAQAREKFEATTNTHCVVKAIRQGIL